MSAEFPLPRVKVCGLRNNEEVAVALAAGADALGFVLHSASPRAVDPQRLAALTGAIGGPAAAIGVLVDARPEAALELARGGGLAALQLCGRERAGDWRGFPVPLLRRVAAGAGADDELAAWTGVAMGFVLDHPDGAGGTGKPVDPERAAHLAAAAPCLLAGGLHAGNVAAAVARVRPRGVDASSGLERAPGIKDPARVRAFVAAARAALAELRP